MANIKLYLDRRKAKADGTYPLKLSVTRRYARCLIPLDIDLRLEQFDERGGKNGHSWITEHPSRDFFNRFLLRRISEVNEAIVTLESRGDLAGVSNKELKAAIESYLSPKEEKEEVVTFAKVYNLFIKGKTARTKEIYEGTLNKVESFANLTTLTFDDINFEWLRLFELELSKELSVNTIAIHLRNIRAIFNYAIDAGLTTAYPFRKFKIKKEKTPKRSLSIEQLVALRDYQCEPHQEQYREIFMLIFYLIGINTVDLFLAKRSQIIDGRLEYRRAKTHKLYSIKIEPEAQAIIDKYAGSEYLLNIMERYSNYKDYAHRLNENLQNIGEVEIAGRGGKKKRVPILPNVTTYWARHTWATIAHRIGIPKDVISMSLGHELNGSKVTDVYIDYNSEQVDQANRKVIDYVNIRTFF